MSLTIRLPWPPPELSPNTRPHWTVKANASAQYRRDCYIAIREAVGPSPEWAAKPGTVVTAAVVFVVPDRRRRDLDNALASIKGAFDAMVAFRLLVDDDSKHLKLAAPEMRYSKGEQHVEVTLSHE